MTNTNKTIDSFAFWIENEEKGVCHIPLNICEKVLKLLKEQDEQKQKWLRKIWKISDNQLDMDSDDLLTKYGQGKWDGLQIAFEILTESGESK